MGHSTAADSPKVICLFGAGVSVSIGVPAMQGMVSDFLVRSKSGISKQDKATCNFFMNDLGVPKDLEEFLLTANAIAEYPSTRTNVLVERSISSRKVTNNILDYRKRLDEYRRDAAHLRESILDFMARTCFQFDREKASSLFTPLVTSLARLGYPVYTTNYDFALEDVAQRAGIALHDNFVVDGLRSLWNPEIAFDRGDGLTLIKLHGSVTWYSGRDGIIEKIHAYTDINPIGHDVSRLVIAPTRFKDIYAQHFFALYSHFLSALADARVLVVAGHSLRDDYLRAAIIERYRKGDFNLVVVGPTFPQLLSSELEVARAGRPGPVVHVPFKFEDFADEFAAICEDVAPEHFANACAEVVHQQKYRSNRLSIKGNIGALKVGSVKDFTAEIDAYLRRTEKPARVRVWLEAEYVDSDGQERTRVSSKFLESAPIEIGTGWTGVVKSTHAMRITVPQYAAWLEHASTATLRVAVVRRSAKSPSQVGEHSILAEDSRELTYHS